MIVWSQTVGASTPNPVQRRLKITRGITPQHAIQWRKRRLERGEGERTETNTKRKSMDKQKRYSKR